MIAHAAEEDPFPGRERPGERGPIVVPLADGVGDVAALSQTLRKGGQVGGDREAGHSDWPGVVAAVGLPDEAKMLRPVISEARLGTHTAGCMLPWQ